MVKKYRRLLMGRQGKLEGWLLLRSVRGLGERSLKKLWETFGSAEAILKASSEELGEVLGVKRTSSLLRREGVDDRRVENILRTVEREGLGFLTLEDETYPESLRVIPDPPPVLFYRGSLEKVSLFGLVGPRKPTGYSLSWTERVVREGVRLRWGVVSGGAPGIDSKAHTVAIDSGGYTVCVLGFGILEGRSPLLRRIVEAGGVLMSEFDPEDKGDKHTFPKRNRIISALSQFLIIPEAGKESGALITADYAYAYGRRIYVHIGIGSSPNWEGCYRLLKERKAEPVRGPEDIFETVGGGDELHQFLRTPRSLEEVASFMGKDVGETISVLTKLEMEGKVRRFGAFYTSC